MSFNVDRLRSWIVVTALFLVSLSPVHAQDTTATATNLCAIAVGIFSSNQYNKQQVLGSQPLQIALQQTGGSGIYPELQAIGPATTFYINNPHFDQDNYLGELFHFHCTSEHQTAKVKWDLKFAASTGKIEYFAFEFDQAQIPAQQTPQQQIPQQQPAPTQPAPQQQTQNTPQQSGPWSGPQQAPDPAEACQMFPGMC